MRILAGKGWHSALSVMKHNGCGGTDPSAANLEPDIAEDDSDLSDANSTTTRKWRDGHAAHGNGQVHTLPLSDYYSYRCLYTPISVKYFFDGQLVQTVDIALQPKGKMNIWVKSIAMSPEMKRIIDNARSPGA